MEDLVFVTIASQKTGSRDSASSPVDGGNVLLSLFIFEQYRKKGAGMPVATSTAKGMPLLIGPCSAGWMRRLLVQVIYFRTKNSIMDGAMKLVTSEPLPHIPSCKIRGRLIPAYTFLPRLKKLCVSLGFNDPIVTRSGEAVANLAAHLLPGAGEIQDGMNAPDHVIILSARLAYKQEWGAYSGLSGLQFQLACGTEASATPADFIVPYLRQYHFAQAHVHLGCDRTGNPIITLPDSLVCGRFNTGGVGLQVDIAGIAEPGAILDRTSSSAGTLVTYSLAAQFRQTLDEKNFIWQPGVFSPIGDHLVPELFTFTGDSWQTESSPFPEVLAMMPWIVTHKTPHLAATLVNLRTGFSRVCQAFAATGQGDLRNLICVAGLEIDMRGFRGRNERYYVPWQACWKRHGFSYGTIYPLLQDDLFVALMNFDRQGAEAEDSDTEL